MYIHLYIYIYIYTYIHIYIYIYYGHEILRLCSTQALSRILVWRLALRPISELRFWISEGSTQAKSSFKGWNSQIHRELPGNSESSNLGRDNLCREIGRNTSKL